MVYTEYFAEGTVPTETCDHHTSVTICNDSGQIASTFCPNTSTGVYIVGGSAGTGDAPYLLSEDVLNSICSLHTSASEDLDNLEIPNVTIDPIETGNGESSEGASGSSNSSGSSSGSGTSGSGTSTSSGTTQTHSSN
jgi:penicillin-binding protein 1A